MNTPPPKPDALKQALGALPVPPLSAAVQVGALEAAQDALAVPSASWVLMNRCYEASVWVLLLSAGLAHQAMEVMAMVRIWG